MINNNIIQFLKNEKYNGNPNPKNSSYLVFSFNEIGSFLNCSKQHGHI